MSKAPVPSRRFVLVQAVTFVRLPLALLFAAVLLYCPASNATVIAGVVLLALIELSDVLDGMLARRFGIVSEFGSLLDPYSDSISRITVYWALAAAQLTLMAVPWTMVFRDISVAYCRVLWARRGQSGSARISGKIKAIVQGTGGFFLLLSPVLLTTYSRSMMWAVSCIVLLVTLASLVEYAIGTVQAMKRPKSV